MKIRFQADADLKHAILAGTLGREPGLDFQRAGAVPLKGVPDPMVLTLAAEEGRVLVSHDVNTMKATFKSLSRNRTAPA